MKFISKENLIALVQSCQNRSAWSPEDVVKLVEAFGEEWYHNRETGKDVKYADPKYDVERAKKEGWLR